MKKSSSIQVLHHKLIGLLVIAGLLLSLIMYFVKGSYLWASIPLITSIFLSIVYAVIIEFILTSKIEDQIEIKEIKKSLWSTTFSISLISLFIALPIYVIQDWQYINNYSMRILVPLKFYDYIIILLISLTMGLLINDIVRIYWLNKKRKIGMLILEFIGIALCVFGYIVAFLEYY